ncbi:MAG TPA: histidine kinase dimerization/phospho-acceptor domain-containing protein [Candidatus Acidoferrum sp.]|nr:histidine kinase dimerization/phospho-acceptor domain-containing protein [Candidatus Acidoferrum sp.]
MSVVAWRREVHPSQAALAGIQLPDLAVRIASLMDRSAFSRVFSLVPSLACLREESRKAGAPVILLDESLLGEMRLSEALASLPSLSPVIFLGGAARQAEAAAFMAQGNVDFVLKSGDFEYPAVALLERRLRAAWRTRESTLPERVKSAEELSSIFRHEINNPLTGILGNAELLLGHRDRLPAAETQRLQTIVELAVRLRENIRRLSVEWDTSMKSAQSR